MPLHDLLTHARVAILDGHALESSASGEAEASSATRVLDAAAWLLADDTDVASIARALHERETRASTSLGFGVAIPHARVAEVEECRAAFLRLEHPVDFGAADGTPVDLVLALLVPEHDIDGQVRRLAEIAERFADAGYRTALRDARDAGQLHRLLSRPGPDFLPCAA